MRFAGRIDPASVSGMFATGQIGDAAALVDFGVADDLDLDAGDFVGALAVAGFPACRTEFCAAATDIWPRSAEPDIISAPKKRREFANGLMNMVGVESA